MHKLLTALTIFTLLSLTLFATAQDNDSAAPSLTIYNQNFFVARDHLTLDLKPGANHIDFAGVTAHLEPDSVILRDLTGRPLQILEQSYRADPISQEMLLSFYEGKTIDFQIQRGEKFETFPGKIIRSGYANDLARERFKLLAALYLEINRFALVKREQHFLGDGVGAITLLEDLQRASGEIAEDDGIGLEVGSNSGEV